MPFELEFSLTLCHWGSVAPEGKVAHPLVLGKNNTVFSTQQSNSVCGEWESLLYLVGAPLARHHTAKIPLFREMKNIPPY